MSQEPSFYAVIPATVRYDRSLPPAAKLLFGEITALANKEGFCYAGNAYFADLYDVGKDTVSIWINKLDKAGYIRIEIDRKAGNIRRIYLSEKIAIPIAKKSDTYSEKTVEVSEKIAIPIAKNDEHNIIYNNTSNNKEIPVVPADAETAINVAGIGEITRKNIALYITDLSDTLRVNFLSENTSREFPNLPELQKAVRAFRERNKPKVSPMVKPTLEELTVYMGEKGMSPKEAEKFFNFYESNGWHVGKKPMQKWKAAVATWKNSDFRKPEPAPVQRTPSSSTTYQDLLKPEYR